jgi:nucleotide-binding universal stress UspA family protein
MTDGLHVETILVPLDGSQLAEEALLFASRLATRIGSELVLLSAVDSAEEVREREQYLTKVSPPGVRVRLLVIVDHDAARAIHDAVTRLPDAIVCLSTHGRGRSGALIGSVAHELLLRSEGPMLAVGQLYDRTLHGEAVLACVDERPISTVSIPVSIDWAQLVKSRSVVTTVAEDVLESVEEDVPTHRSFGPDGDVAAYLRDVTRPWRESGSDVGTLALYDPISPASGMRTHLQLRPAMLVAVSTRPRRGMELVRSGSVAMSILHQSPVPVLIVPRTASETSDGEREVLP